MTIPGAMNSARYTHPFVLGSGVWSDGDNAHSTKGDQALSHYPGRCPKQVIHRRSTSL
jgi:hypothetical protein